jgi:hypothetical protein
MRNDIIVRTDAKEEVCFICLSHYMLCVFLWISRLRLSVPFWPSLIHFSPASPDVHVLQRMSRPRVCLSPHSITQRRIALTNVPLSGTTRAR